MKPSKPITAQHLQYLVALVSECHVTRAAQKMGIGQPAMSTALARLRELFDDPLLIKTTHGMQATPRAIELARRAQDAIELLSGGQRTVEVFDPATATGHFHIMASEGISVLLAPPLLERVRAKAPQLQLTISAGDILRATEYLRNGEIDLLVAFVQKPANDLYQSLLYSQRLVCIANKEHARIQGELTLEQFITQAHVVWGAPPTPVPTFEAMVTESLRKLGLRRKVALFVSSMASTAAVAARTDLLAVVPDRLAASVVAALPLQVLPLPFDVPRVDVSMFWHQRWHDASAHAWLRAELRETARNLRHPTVYGRLLD